MLECVMNKLHEKRLVKTHFIGWELLQLIVLIS